MSAIMPDTPLELHLTFGLVILILFRYFVPQTKMSVRAPPVRMAVPARMKWIATSANARQDTLVFTVKSVSG